MTVIASGPFRLHPEPSGAGLGLALAEGGHAPFVSEHPLFVGVLGHDGVRREFCGAYREAQVDEGRLVCRGALATNHGSLFTFEDVFAPANGGFSLARTVRVEKADGHDAGFETRFSMAESGAHPFDDYGMTVPGIWYQQNSQVVDGAFAGERTHTQFLFRATRAALPYVQMHNLKTGAHLSLCHQGPRPQPSRKEPPHETMVDALLRYPSIGIVRTPAPAVTYCCPGSEGELNYTDVPVGMRGRGWAWRYHPVAADARQQYGLLLYAGRDADKYAAMRAAWRHFYGVFHPAVRPCDIDAVYRAGAALLSTYCQDYNGAMGIPFWCAVPEGTVCDISFQMGFVGQQLMCAYHLLRRGTETGDARMLAQANGIIGFWLAHARKAGVVPQVWYDVFPPQFRPEYPCYTRTFADGLEGMLLCWQYARRQGQDEPAWLQFCTETADWLVRAQNPDGSFYRAYTPDGAPAHTGKENTSNLVRFLVELFWATGRAAYRSAALAAGEYVYEHSYLPLCYAGGTADNDNTIDKEAGMQALYAFLALYDETTDEKWLKAACGAADFCETWTYCWAFDVRPFKGNAVFEQADITGLSLIATGHSHADVMMAYCYFDFYRLSLHTGDAHYRDFALFLQHNTKQTTDWSGRLGHAYAGLVEESGEVATQYHNGLGRWLPWCTIAEIEPITRMREWFGTARVEDAAGFAPGVSPRSSWLK